VDWWQKTRRWIAALLYVAAAPAPPTAAWLLYDQQGPNPATLAVTVVAGATAVLCLLGGLAAARTARAHGYTERSTAAARPSHLARHRHDAGRPRG
jgi:hypothetical protein